MAASTFPTRSLLPFLLFLASTTGGITACGHRQADGEQSLVSSIKGDKADIDELFASFEDIKAELSCDGMGAVMAKSLTRDGDDKVAIVFPLKGKADHDLDCAAAIKGQAKNPAQITWLAGANVIHEAKGGVLKKGESRLALAFHKRYRRKDQASNGYMLVVKGGVSGTGLKAEDKPVIPMASLSCRGQKEIALDPRDGMASADAAGNVSFSLPFPSGVSAEASWEDCVASLVIAPSGAKDKGASYVSEPFALALRGGIEKPIAAEPKFRRGDEAGDGDVIVDGTFEKDEAGNKPDGASRTPVKSGSVNLGLNALEVASLTPNERGFVLSIRSPKVPGKSFGCTIRIYDAASGDVLALTGKTFTSNAWLNFSLATYHPESHRDAKTYRITFLCDSGRAPGDGNVLAKAELILINPTK